MPIVSPILSPSQLRRWRGGRGAHGRGRRGPVRVGDARYPFIAILEGEAAILDGAGNEIVRHGAVAASSASSTC